LIVSKVELGVGGAPVHAEHLEEVRAGDAASLVLELGEGFFGDVARRRRGPVEHVEQLEQRQQLERGAAAEPAVAGDAISGARGIHVGLEKAQLARRNAHFLGQRQLVGLDPRGVTEARAERVVELLDRRLA